MDLKGCTCDAADAKAKVRIVPLCCASCLFECKGCNAIQLVELNGKEHLLPLVGEIKKFDYERGWSDGKYLPCLSKQKDSDGSLKTCDNENPETFRYVMRTSGKYHHCHNCEACVPVVDDDMCNSSFTENPACPLCNHVMQTVEENGREEACRVCWSCDGVLPLIKIRDFERARECEAQKGKACALCGGALKREHGLIYFKCLFCESTMVPRPLRDASFAADANPIKCVNCYETQAYAMQDANHPFSECTQCGAVRLQQPTPAGQNGAGNAVGDKVVCGACTSEEFVYRLDGNSLLVTCAICDKLVRSFDFDEKEKDGQTVMFEDSGQVDNALNLLACTALKTMAVRIDGPPCLIDAVVQWALTALQVVRRAAAGEIAWSVGLELIVFDFLKHAVVTLGNMGIIELERSMAAVLLRSNVPQPLVNEAVNLLGTAARDARDVILEKVQGQLSQASSGRF